MAFGMAFSIVVVLGIVILDVVFGYGEGLVCI
jgi:hypothetical protein